jgi:Domain of unknown function (DUF4158)
MPSLERTAYPRFARVITAQELERAYTPSQEELTWARGTVRTPNHLLCLGILLKSFQRLHYFPDLDAVPSELRSCALYCAFEHFGNTGENIKRMQGTREYPKISVIEINSCEVRPTNCCKAIAQVWALFVRVWAG